MGIYVRADRKKGRSYYRLVESHREGKRVVQKRIKYLGISPPPSAILEKLKQEYILSDLLSQPSCALV